MGGITNDSTDGADVSMTIDASVITDTNDVATISAAAVADPDYLFTITGGAAADSLPVVLVPTLSSVEAAQIPSMVTVVLTPLRGRWR